MEKVCPLCNGLEAVKTICSECGRRMVDGGALEDFLGPYSPYMETESINYGLPEQQCVHLLYCPACHNDARAALEYLSI